MMWRCKLFLLLAAAAWADSRSFNAKVNGIAARDSDATDPVGAPTVQLGRTSLLGVSIPGLQQEFFPGQYCSNEYPYSC
jgi:hypothetical protein